MAIFKRLALFVATVAIAVAGYMLYLRHEHPLPTPALVRNDNAVTANEEPPRPHGNLSAEAKLHVLDGDFTLVRSTSGLPAAIKSAFAAITREEQFELANPGQNYQMTDVIEEAGLPIRRLKFAGNYQNRWFLEYEHGGIGLSYAVIVLDVRPDGSVDFVWGGTGFRSATDLTDLRRGIASGEFRDDLKFYW